MNVALFSMGQHCHHVECVSFILAQVCTASSSLFLSILASFESADWNHGILQRLNIDLIVLVPSY